MSENWMLRNVLFVRKFVEKAHESSFPLGNEIQVAQPVRGGPRGTKWGLHNLYFDWASSSRATDNVGYIAVSTNFFLALKSIYFHPRTSLYPPPVGFCVGVVAKLIIEK